jgi:hypothetical protein
MKKFGSFFANLLVSVISFIVMILLAIISFYVVMLVVSAGSAFAGIKPSADFLVLSGSLIVVAAILAGGISPVAFMSSVNTKKDEEREQQQINS